MKKKSVKVLIPSIILTGFMLLTQGTKANALMNNDIKTIKIETTIKELKEGSPQKISLQEAIDIALKNNPNIEEARLNLDKVKVEYDKYRYNLSDKKENMDNDDYKIEKELNNLKHNIAKLRYEDIIENEKIEIEKIYFNLLHRMEELEIYKEGLDIAHASLDRARKELNVGIGTELEVDMSELNYIKAGVELSDLENKLKTDKMTYNIALGYDIEEDIDLSDKLEYRIFKEVDIKKIIDSQYEKNADYKEARLEYELAKYDFDTTKRKYPSNTFQYREKDVVLKKAERKLKEIKKEIQKEVQTQYNMIMEKNKSIKANEKAVKLAEKILKQTTLMYELGMKELRDMDEAQNKLKLEKLQLAKNILDYNIAVLEFNKNI